MMNRQNISVCMRFSRASVVVGPLLWVTFTLLSPLGEDISIEALFSFCIGGYCWVSFIKKCHRYILNNPKIFDIFFTVGFDTL